MERYVMTLSHEYVDEETKLYLEDPIECSVTINSLDDSIALDMEYMIYDMCESIISYLRLEKEGNMYDRIN